VLAQVEAEIEARISRRTLLGAVLNCIAILAA
jgi:hypothetical protein